MPDYDFHQLSPDDFERLTRDLLQAELGFRLESFKPGKDGGIDLRYATGPGNLIVQCKHYARTGLAGLLRDLRKEAPKVGRLRPSRYIVVTSVPLSPPNKDTIREIFSPDVLGVSDIFGSDDLNNLLGLNPEIEQKHYKLWLASKAVFDRVLHNAQITRSAFLVRKVYQEIKKYVPSAAYPRALDMLQKDNVVIIAGPPGVGKTTLANMLLYEHVEKGFQAVVIQRDVEEGESLLSEGAKQIFYFDDFMGSALLDDKSAFSQGDDKALIEFMSAVRASKTARFVLTTREHILSQAFAQSERLRHSAIYDFKVSLHIPDYHFVDKARILYNHLYFSDLPAEYQDQLLRANFYLEIIRHEKFNPRLIEWLSSYRRVKAIQPRKYQGFVRQLLADPSEIWRHAYEQEISNAARSILLALFSFGGRSGASNLKDAFNTLHAERSNRYKFATRPEDFRSALREIAGAFIKTTSPHIVETLDPSILDLLNTVIGESPDNAIDIVRSSLSFDQIQRVWAFARSKKDSLVMPTLLLHADEIAPIISQCMLATRRVKFKGGVAYVGVTLEKRLATIVDIASTLGAPSILGLVGPMADYMFAEWSAGDCDIDAGADLVRTLESDRSSGVPNRDDLRSRTRDGLLEAATNAVFSNELAELISVFDFDDPQDSAALPILREAFKAYRSRYFRDDLRDCRSGKDYEALAETLDLFRSELGVDVADLNERVEIAKSEFEELQGGYEDQMYDEWKDRYYAERADDESVTSMFDTLKGDRD